MIKIFIEGPDNSGKTTLAKALVEEFNLDYRHCSKPKTDDPFTEYMNMIMNTEQSTVFDRGYLGEFVYSNLWRGGCKLDFKDFQALDRCALRDSKTIIIHATADFSCIRERCIDQKEELLQLDQIVDCMNLFDLIIERTLCPVIKYNSSVQKPEEIVELLRHFMD